MVESPTETAGRGTAPIAPTPVLHSRWGTIALPRLSPQAVLTTDRPLRVLLVHPSRELPPAVRELIQSRPIEIVHARNFREARDPARLAGVDAVVIVDSENAGFSESGRSDLQLLADVLSSHRLMGLVVSPGAPGGVPGDDDTPLDVLGDTTADELWGRIATIRKHRAQLRRMENHVAIMQRLGKKLNQHFVEVDQELRLANRLQRNFLPQTLPEVGDVRFASLYRPATWVSGDDYDVRRLDESRVSFFMADAVGHGVAAGLLTMFIRQALVGKRISRNDYTVIPPEEVLTNLNRELSAQDLPNCQFVTACYGHVEVDRHEITFARGGHPHPIHVAADGTCREVRTVGGLLGVFPDEEFVSAKVLLEPGEKLILYSDGLEDAIICRHRRESGQIRFTADFLDLVRYPAPACVKALADTLDRAEGSLQPADDQTCLIIERTGAN